MLKTVSESLLYYERVTYCIGKLDEEESAEVERKLAPFLNLALELGSRRLIERGVLELVLNALVDVWDPLIF